MTSPMLQLPDWYEGGCIDAEDLIKRYFSRLLGDSVTVCTWLPPGHYILTPGEEVGGTKPTLRIWRQPGKFDPTARRDQALVQLAAITPTRKESWELVEFVRRMMDDEVISRIPVELSNGDEAAVTCSEEWLGPQLVPERLVDEKFIPITFKVTIPEPSGLPNYRQIIKNLP
ncbi:Uncharacterised protein [Mycobacteroides abscessus subsp. massiliense]|nr:Uncharacterised protein [Mycobacteroides abscessus subsp. massiliense]